MQDDANGTPSRLRWHDRTMAEIRSGVMPHLPDGKVYGWMTLSGVVHAGKGYPVPRSRFALDSASCAAILVLRTTPDADGVERGAMALGLHRIPGGGTTTSPRTRWPVDENDRLSGRDGTVPLEWDFAQRCRQEARVVLEAGAGDVSPPTGDLEADLADFADRIDRFGFLHAMSGHAAALRKAVTALRSPTRPVAWHWNDDGPPADAGRIVATYGDASGAVMGYWTGDALIDQEGCEREWKAFAGGRWCLLPDGLQLWCETTENDPFTFPDHDGAAR